MSLLSSENHAPVQLGAIAFANLGMNEVVQGITILLSVGYFIIYWVDKKKEWGRKDAAQEGKKQEGSPR